MRPVLCLVTDRSRLPPGTGLDAVVRSIRLAAEAGVDLVQIRERRIDDRSLTDLVARCVDAARGTRTRVVVNDRLDVALAGGAHGVHLPGHGVPGARVRAVAPRGFLIGRSVHHATEAAREAKNGGLDYLVFGTVYPSSSKEGIAPAGIEGLRAAVRAVPLPVLAIGGVTIARAREIASSGAAGVAAIGMFADALRAVDSLEDLVAQWGRRW